MIRYIKGLLMSAEEGRVVVLTGGIGYEILLPEIVWNSVMNKHPGEDEIELFISYHQTAQQPKPTLIGFTSEVELEFFKLLTRVKDIGPVMASKALTMPVSVIAKAIEERDTTTIQKLKGVGKRKADMIVSELNGKAGKFALMRDKAVPHAAPLPDDLSKQVIEVLVKQLGHNRGDAVKLVDTAFERTPDIATPEELFEEVYRGIKSKI